MNPSNYTTISLFGLEINPPRSIDIGSLSIQFYGIIIACGLLLAVLYGCKRCKEFGFSADDLTDGVLWIVPLAIFCARLYYCAFAWDSYKNNPISIFYIWNGGLAIYGGVIGAALGVILFSKLKKIKVGAVLDLVAIGFLIGQAMGRWGNFMNAEAHGIKTDLIWGMSINGTGPYHPTFLYESLWNIIGFAVLTFVLYRFKQYDGQIYYLGAAYYGLGRFMIEGLRTDSMFIGEVRTNQFLAGAAFVIYTGLLIYNAIKKNRTHGPAWINQPQTNKEKRK